MTGEQSLFNKIVKDIKSVKIQGARNVARASLRAYRLIPTEKSKEILLASRPTEPMMHRVLEIVSSGYISYNDILNHFDFAQNKINKIIYGLVKNNSVVFTHCHSTNVSNALIYAHRKGKHFEVYNTETRPLYQGRTTAKELRSSGIKVTMFVDSALGIALGKEQGAKKVSMVLIGADALLKEGIINKVGSGLVSRIAKEEKIPVYIVADSWKFTKEKIKIEQRSLNEVWDNAPKKIKIKNPAFEFVHKKYISGIITELGLMKYGEFLKKIKG